jgi:hypothetical protein
MFYYVIVTFSLEDKGSRYNGVGCVWADDHKHALKKSLCLYEPYTIHSIEINKLELDTIRKTATLGGMVLARFEEFLY